MVLALALATAFEEFWHAFPRHVGKLAARTAYARVRHRGVSHQTIMDAVARYIATKPAFAEYCHPTTWLHQGRWMDEVDERPLSAAEVQHARSALTRIYFGRCPHDPPCHNSDACVNALAYGGREKRSDV